jgi:GT2 family glycosyltransferase
VPASIAIITPTHQRRQSLARVLDGLTRQSYPLELFSVVVVCDGCTDGTAEMLRANRYPYALRVLEQSPSQGPAAARNLALQVVDAAIVLFLDDDVVPSEQLVAFHAAHHEARPNAVVIGPLLAPSFRQQPWIRWESETLLQQYRAMEAGAWEPTPRQFYTGNASVGRDQLIAAGGFDRRFRRGEDVDLAFRLQRCGARFFFESRAGGTHIARRSFASWAEAAREYGRLELAMGPVWGERGLVDVKALEFRRRHSIVRRIVDFGLRHPHSARALMVGGRVVGRVLSTLRLWPWARGAYTAMFELAYWRGVDDARQSMGGDADTVPYVLGQVNVEAPATAQPGLGAGTPDSVR